VVSKHLRAGLDPLGFSIHEKEIADQALPEESLQTKTKSVHVTCLTLQGTWFKSSQVSSDPDSHISATSAHYFESCDVLKLVVIDCLFLSLSLPQHLTGLPHSIIKSRKTKRKRYLQLDRRLKLASGLIIDNNISRFVSLSSTNCVVLHRKQFSEFVKQLSNICMWIGLPRLI
jgi:hypothetical protein